MDKKNNNLLFFLLIIVSVFVAFGTNYVCPWRRYFHIYCAGCGVTRMIKSIVALDFYQAFRYNQLFFILFVLMAFYFVYILVSKAVKKSYYKFSDKYLWLLLILIVSYTILRNIKVFSFLIPTKV